MQYRFLEIGKAGRSGRSAPVIEKDALSGGELPHHYSLGDFSSVTYLNAVIKENNELVAAAVAWGVSLPSYGQFYQLGLRASQQLHGRVWDMTSDKHSSAYGAVKVELFAGIMAARRRRRDEGLEGIVASGSELPADDKRKVEQMASALKGVPVRDRSKDLHELRQIIRHYESDQASDDRLSENYARVAPELRADYLAVIKFADLNGVQSDFTSGTAEEIRQLLGSLIAGNGRKYLQALQSELARNSLDFWHFYDVTGKAIRGLEPSHHNLYFGALKLAQDKNLPHSREHFASYAIELAVRLGSRGARGIVWQALEAGPEGFMDVIDAHRHANRYSAAR